MTKSEEPTDPEPEDQAGPIPAGAVSSDLAEDVDDDAQDDQLSDVVPVSLYWEEVPPELDPGRFFKVMCERLLDNSPINFHVDARRKKRDPLIEIASGRLSDHGATDD